MRMCKDLFVGRIYEVSVFKMLNECCDNVKLIF